MSFKKYFYKEQLNEAIKGDMLDISIKNIDKVVTSEKKAKEFLTKNYKVEEKTDGTKLTLLRNDQPFDKDYTKNWIVAYKSNILYPGEFDSVDREKAKTASIGTGQYALVHDILKANHKKTKGIKPNTEFFVEFIMDKPTLTRDYTKKHNLVLIAYSPTEYIEKFGKLKTMGSEFNTEGRDKYAKMLGIDVPALLFDGKFTNAKTFEKGIKSKELKESFEMHKDKYDNESAKDTINVLKEIFTDYESAYGGKPEGAVLIDDDGKIVKILQADQHDKDTRRLKAAKWKMEPEREGIYYGQMKDLANEVVSKINIDDLRTALRDLSDIVYKMVVPVEHEKKTNQMKQDDLFLSAKSVIIKSLKGNNWAYFQGRLQPPTKAHIQIIENALKKYDGVVVALAKGKKTDKAYLKDNPFSDEMQRKMLNDIFGDRVQIERVGSGFIPRILQGLDQNVNFVIAGEDRYDDYVDQLKNTSGIQVVKIPRTAEDVSATKLRQALLDDNKQQFEANADQRMFKYYDELRDEILTTYKNLGIDVGKDDVEEQNDIAMGAKPEEVADEKGNTFMAFKKKDGSFVKAVEDENGKIVPKEN